MKMSADTHSVNAIFARAERVFERRVEQLLQAKRAKALAAGAPFNARKAKRDARTVAGREKLDALVRRLADLASVQEAALPPEARSIIAAKLDASAAAVLAVAALAAEPERAKLTKEKDELKDLDTSSCSDDSSSVGAKDSPEPDALDVMPRPAHALYPATKSVVEFVLQCDDDLDPVLPDLSASAAHRYAPSRVCNRYQSHLH